MSEELTAAGQKLLRATEYVQGGRDGILEVVMKAQIVEAVFEACQGHQ